MSNVVNLTGEFFTAVRLHRRLEVLIVARGSEDACMRELEAFLATRPKSERGRHYHGELDAGLSDVEFAEQVGVAAGLMDANIDRNRKRPHVYGESVVYWLRPEGQRAVA